jgi:hypothetical protein
MASRLLDKRFTSLHVIGGDKRQMFDGGSIPVVDGDLDDLRRAMQAEE